MSYYQILDLGTQNGWNTLKRRTKQKELKTLQMMLKKEIGSNSEQSVNFSQLNTSDLNSLDPSELHGENHENASDTANFRTLFSRNH